jgi:hypothetical protein
VFIDEQVGLQPSDTDGSWDVFFSQFVAGQLDERTGKIRRASSLSEWGAAEFRQTAGSITK